MDHLKDVRRSIPRQLPKMGSNHSTSPFDLQNDRSLRTRLENDLRSEDQQGWLIKAKNRPIEPPKKSRVNFPAKAYSAVARPPSMATTKFDDRLGIPKAAGSIIFAYQLWKFKKKRLDRYWSSSKWRTTRFLWVCESCLVFHDCLSGIFWPCLHKSWKDIRPFAKGPESICPFQTCLISLDLAIMSTLYE